MPAIAVQACRYAVIIVAAVALPLLAIGDLPAAGQRKGFFILSWIQSSLPSWVRPVARQDVGLVKAFELPGETLRYHSGSLPEIRPADHRLPANEQAIESRLQDLGATFYRLKPWGISGELFRFETKVAIHDPGGLQRYFEAVAPDPLIAMQSVLAEVESWRAGETQ